MEDRSKFFAANGDLVARWVRRALGTRKSRRSGTKSRKQAMLGKLMASSSSRIRAKRRALLNGAG